MSRQDFSAGATEVGLGGVIQREQNPFASLMADYFRQPPETNALYEITLRCVAEQMEAA
jgi:hypothetical protein